MTTTKTTKREAAVAMFRALAVLATDEKLRALLLENDPKSFEQIENAIAMAYVSKSVTSELYDRLASDVSTRAIERRAAEVARQREATRCRSTKDGKRCWLMADHSGLHEDDGGDLEWEAGDDSAEGKAAFASFENYGARGAKN